MHVGVHPYSSPGRGVLSVITRCCFWYFIYYQFIITDNHFIWKVNIASPIHGIIFLRLPFIQMLHINFPSVNKRLVCSGSLVDLNLITFYVCFYHHIFEIWPIPPTCHHCIRPISAWFHGNFAFGFLFLLTYFCFPCQI